MAYMGGMEFTFTIHFELKKYVFFLTILALFCAYGTIFA